MSGQSRSGGGGDFEPNDSCEIFGFNTQISSPKEDVVNNIQEGDFLDIALDTSGNLTTVVVMHQGSIAGGIASPHVNRLVQCIQQGHIYNAYVKQKNEGQIFVKVSSKKQD